MSATGRRTKADRRPAGLEVLLVELLTEELPPKSLTRLSEAFAEALIDQLRERDLVGPEGHARALATPRRLAVLITAVRARQRDRVVERRGPAVRSALDAHGDPTPALLGFARSCGVDPAALERQPDGKGEYFVYRARQRGGPLSRHLGPIVEDSLRRLPVSRLMRWGAGEAQFVRPAHGLVMLHGARVVPGTVLGLKSGRVTRGHRFLSRAPVAIPRAQDYERTLALRGAVTVDHARRMTSIAEQLSVRAGALGAGASWRLPGSDELLEEVASLVELPVVYTGGFDPAFLQVPRECLIVSMRQHQRYFPVIDTRGRLMPHFLFVGNTRTRVPDRIIHGNERVLRARLADAKFFFDQDRKTRLADRVERLGGVVYQHRLGTQRERVGRLQSLAAEIARRLGADVATAERAAYLCKADLLTEMVGEFPELQGVMGAYYAEHDGEPETVAGAIRDHYRPRFAADALPRSVHGAILALADKLDTLVGIYGIGLVPTGDKDPYGLRRQALGVVRLLVERTDLPPLDVRELLGLAHACFAPALLDTGVVSSLYGFLLDRLRPYLRERGFGADEIEAVLALDLVRFDQIVPRLEALRRFRASPEGDALAAANKRIRNILRQADGAVPERFDPTSLREPAERVLAREIEARAAEIAPLIDSGDYAQALTRLAGLRPAVDAFFDQVMVMVEDAALRGNRLALLQALGNLFLRLADISRLRSGQP